MSPDVTPVVFGNPPGTKGYDQYQSIIVKIETNKDGRKDASYLGASPDYTINVPQEVGNVQRADIGGTILVDHSSEMR